MTSTSSQQKIPKVMVLIPARYGSTRFPAKPLASILGRPMVQRVYENMLSDHYQTAVVTDHTAVQAVIEKIGGTVFLVPDDVLTGTERIGLAYDRFLKNDYWDLIINVQGDEPLLLKTAIEKLITFHLQSNFDIATLFYPRIGEEELLQSSHIVKIAMNSENGQCFYFSRSPIPFYRQELDQKKWAWKQHVGVYSYRPEILAKFINLPPTDLELAESLEQLRAIESNVKIGAMAIDHLPQGVDTVEDLTKVEKMLAKNVAQKF